MMLMPREDQGGQQVLERIRQLFGERVAGIVAACSDTDATPKPAWREPLLVLGERVADQPEHRRPESHEQRAPLGISALVLLATAAR